MLLIFVALVTCGGQFEHLVAVERLLLVDVDGQAIEIRRMLTGETGGMVSSGSTVHCVKTAAFVVRPPHAVSPSHRIRNDHSVDLVIAVGHQRPIYDLINLLIVLFAHR